MMGCRVIDRYNNTITATETIPFLSSLSAFLFSPFPLFPFYLFFYVCVYLCARVMSVVQERSSLSLSYASSFEDSRPHWLGDSCRCSSEDLYNTIAKLEQEARLAAGKTKMMALFLTHLIYIDMYALCNAIEIGQTLLQKHDALKHESAQLEKQVSRLLHMCNHY